MSLSKRIQPFTARVLVVYFFPFVSFIFISVESSSCPPQRVFQHPISPEDCWNTIQGQLTGLHGLPVSPGFSRNAWRTHERFLRCFVLVYIDDIIIYSRNQEHLVHVLTFLEASGMSFALFETHFAQIQSTCTCIMCPVWHQHNNEKLLHFAIWRALRLVCNSWVTSVHPLPCSHCRTKSYLQSSRFRPLMVNPSTMINCSGYPNSHKPFTIYIDGLKNGNLV